MAFINFISFTLFIRPQTSWSQACLWLIKLLLTILFSPQGFIRLSLWQVRCGKTNEQTSLGVNSQIRTPGSALTVEPSRLTHCNSEVRWCWFILAAVSYIELYEFLIKTGCGSSTMNRASVFCLLKWTSRSQLHSPRLFLLTFFLWSLSKDQSGKNLYRLSDILKKCNAKYLDNFPTFRILHILCEY